VYFKTGVVAVPHRSQTDENLTTTGLKTGVREKTGKAIYQMRGEERGETAYRTR